MDRTITALKVQKRNPNRVNVFLDSEYAFGVARIVAAWLRVGQTLSEEKIASLQEQDSHEVAFQRALQFLSYRPRSQAEVQNKLTALGYAQPVVEAVMQRLIQAKLVGDKEFSQLWVENRTTFRPRSRRVLSLELRQKGVEEQYIQDAIAGVEDEEALAYQAAVQRAQRWSNMEWKDFRVKAGSFLARRGFSFDTIFPVVQRLWSELHQDQSNLSNENMDGRDQSK